MNAKLQAIAEKSASDLIALIKDAEPKILEAWAAAEEEATDEASPKLKLGFSITLDLDKDKMETALTFAIRRKYSIDETIPNPDQFALPMVDNTEVKVVTAAGEATMTTKQFVDGLQKLSALGK